MTKALTPDPCRSVMYPMAAKLVLFHLGWELRQSQLIDELCRPEKAHTAIQPQSCELHTSFFLRVSAEAKHSSSIVKWLSCLTGRNIYASSHGACTAGSQPILCLAVGGGPLSFSMHQRLCLSHQCCQGRVARHALSAGATLIRLTFQLHQYDSMYCCHSFEPHSLCWGHCEALATSGARHWMLAGPCFQQARNLCPLHAAQHVYAANCQHPQAETGQSPSKPNIK